jgi:hypothetical protein
MSGYPYGNPGGGYPQSYGMDNNGYPNYPPNSGFQPPPPAMPSYDNNQSYASFYGTAPPSMPGNNNYSAPPYAANQMPGGSYGYGGGNDYPPPSSFGGQMPAPMYNQPPQQYGGKYKVIYEIYKSFTHVRLWQSAISITVSSRNTTTSNGCVGCIISKLANTLNAIQLWR